MLTWRPCRDLKALIKLLTLLTQRDVLDFGGDDSAADPDIAQVSVNDVHLFCHAEGLDVL